MEKTSPKGEKTFLAVEPETKMFLKTNTLSGKPTLFRGELLFYSTKDAKDLGLNDRFSQYMNEIFKVEAVSAVEDPQPRVRKPKAEQVEVATEPKRLGRKPKEKQEPIQAKDNTVVDKSEKEVQQVNDVLIEEVVAPVVEKIEEKPAEKVVQVIEENISIEEEIIPPQAPKPLSIDDVLPNITELENSVKDKAVKDADYLSDLYINTLLNRFAENMQEKLTKTIDKFVEKLSETFKL